MADGSFVLIVPDSGGKMVMFSLSMMMDGETMKYEAMSDPGEVVTVGGMDAMVDLEASTGMVPPTRTPVQVTESMRGPPRPRWLLPVKLALTALPVLPAPEAPSVLPVPLVQTALMAPPVPLVLAAPPVLPVLPAQTAQTAPVPPVLAAPQVLPAPQAQTAPPALPAPAALPVLTAAAEYWPSWP